MSTKKTTKNAKPKQEQEVTIKQPLKKKEGKEEVK